MYILGEFDSALENILENGIDIQDRTGVGCRFLPGVSVKVDISERVPVPTRRKTAWKSMLKEYLWFLTGSDNIYDLQKMGSKVWDSWLDKEWAKENGFEEGSIGFGYGPNLIDYGGDLDYKPMPEKSGGVNQIDYVLSQLLFNPYSRRILFSFWRPDKLESKDCKLPACHIIYQWVVEPPNKLHCIVYQRSGDYFVGCLSTNLQGAAFYTHMFAQQCLMEPATLTHCCGHAHIYHNHFDGVKEYLQRDRPSSPILHLNKQKTIYSYTSEDFSLTEYKPLPKIKLEVAI